LWTPPPSIQPGWATWRSALCAMRASPTEPWRPKTNSTTRTILPVCPAVQPSSVFPHFQKMTTCTVTDVTKQTLCPNVPNATNSSHRIVSELWMELGIRSASSALAALYSSQGIWATGSRTVNPIVITATLTQCCQSAEAVATLLWIELSRPSTSSGMLPVLCVWSVRRHLRGPRTFTPLRASPFALPVQEFKMNKTICCSSGSNSVNSYLSYDFIFIYETMYYRQISYKCKLRSLLSFFSLEE